MSRNYDWSPLGYYNDPVPGEPGQLVSQVAKYREIADKIHDGATNLNAIVNNYSSQSDFIDAFAEQAEEVIGRIRKAEAKYTGFADAVEGYIEPLRTARRDSYNLLIAARTATDDLATAEKWQRHYQNEFWEADAADQPAIQKKIDRYEDDAADARAIITGNSDKIWAIIETCHAAAKAAANAIQETGDASGINDSGWVQFWEEWGPVFDVALQVIGWLAIALAVVAMFVPGLNLIVLIVGIAIAVATVANAAMQYSAGTKSLGDAIIESCLAILPFGIGRVASKLAANALKAVKSAAPLSYMASQAGRHIAGATTEVAEQVVEAVIKAAKPNLVQKLLFSEADELAQVLALRQLTLNPSQLTNLVDDQMWRFFTGPSEPIASLVYQGIGDLMKDGLPGPPEFVKQPDTW